MSVKRRVTRLEQKGAERSRTAVYFVASEDVAIREGLARSQCIITDDPSDDPPWLCTLTHEEIVDELDCDEGEYAAASA